MPTYEYRCDSCEKTFEVFQSITAEPVSACDYCGGPVRRLISGGGGLLFKGSGFYITDYRSESYKTAEKGEKASAGGEKASAAGDKAAAGADKGSSKGAAAETKSPVSSSASS